ncbi:MAG: polysaccharide pyruvyl transferase family protein [Patescibacteria group bacterium]
MKKIILCGSYGAGNVGDEAILRSLLQSVQKEFKEASITVLCSFPNEEKKYYSAEFPDVTFEWLFPGGLRSFLLLLLSGKVFKTLKSVRSANLFILGGGGLFTDDESIKAVVLWAMQVFIAKLLKVSVRVVAVSVGPFKGRLARFLSKKALSMADEVSVRDNSSAKLLMEMGVKNSIVKDPVFALDVKNIQDNTASVGKYIILSLRPWHSFVESSYKEIAQALDKIVEEFGFDIVFIPFQTAPQNDVGVLNKISVHMRNKNKLFIRPHTLDIGKVYREFVGAQAVIGMRLHSVVFSIITKKPFIMIAYGDKSLGLIEWYPDYKNRILEIVDLNQLYERFKMISGEVK